MQLARVIHHVQSPESLQRFYVERLGMSVIDSGEAVILGYGAEGASLELWRAYAGGNYVHKPEDRYWKIGITLPNVDMAYAQLREAGVEVSVPRQFGEIGYMCHLQDPEGFPIELLQHRFESHPGESEGDRGRCLGGGAEIGQITLRVDDLEGALGFYRDRLGMRLLSIQPLPAYGFTLYFLAFTDERPPHDDLEAISNREWLWQRPYTTLELQHFSDSIGAFTLPADGEPGFHGMTIAGAGDRAACLADEGGVRVELLP